MNSAGVPALISLAAAAAGCGLVARQVRRRGLDRWLVPYIIQAAKRSPRYQGGAVHLLLCIADHYEPRWGKAGPDVAHRRVERWVREYPRLFGGFRDSDGRTPRHTFLFPIDEYESEHVDALAGLCRTGFGEVEVHLHHDGDTAEALRERLLAFKALFRAARPAAARQADGRVGLWFRPRQLGPGQLPPGWALVRRQ